MQGIFSSAKSDGDEMFAMAFEQSGFVVAVFDEDGDGSTDEAFPELGRFFAYEVGQYAVAFFFDCVGDVVF